MNSYGWFVLNETNVQRTSTSYYVTENPRISKHVFKRYRKTGQDKRRRHQGNHFIITCSSRLCFTVRAGVRGKGRGGGGFGRFWLRLQASY